MASELEKLLLRFEADTTALRSALRDAESGVDRFEKNSNNKLGSAEKNFARMGDSAKRVLGQLAAAFAAHASFGALDNLIDSGAKLQVLSDTVGMTAQRYQELSAAARRASVDQTEFDAAMKRFATRVAEVHQRTGPLYEFLRGQLPVVHDQIKGTKDLSSAFDVVSEAVRRLDSAESKALLVKQAFGDESIHFVKALEQGKAGLDDAAKSAREFGQVASNESVRAVKQLREEIDGVGASIKATFMDFLGRAIIDVRKDFNTLKEAFAGGGNEAASAYFTGLEQAQKSGWARVGASAIEGWKTTVDDKLKLQVDPRKMQPGIDMMASMRMQRAEAGGDTLGAFKMQMDAEQAKLKQMLAESIISREQYSEASGHIAARLSAKISEEIGNEARAAREGADVITQLRIKAAEAKGDGLGAFKMQADAELESFRRMLEDKRISETQFQEARALLAQTTAARITQEFDKEAIRVRELTEDFKNIATNSFSSVFDSIVQGSFNAKNALSQLLAEFTKAATMRGVINPLMDGLFGKQGTGDGGGLLTGLIGNVFGMPGRAHGGPMTAGVPYIAGENGPEAIVPSTSALAMPGWKMAGGQSGANVYNIDARQSDAGVVQRVIAAMASLEKNRMSGPEQSMAFSRRFPTRRAA